MSRWRNTDTGVVVSDDTEPQYGSWELVKDEAVKPAARKAAAKQSDTK